MIIAKQLPSVESPHRLLQVTKHLGIPPQRKILRTSTRNFVVQDELDKARRAWKEYQSTQRREATRSEASAPAAEAAY